MIHQLAKRDLKFLIPEYKIPVEATSERSLEFKRIELLVTEERLLVLDELKIDGKFSATIVDILGKVNDIPFAIYITHRNRPVPSDIDPPDVVKSGLVLIDIEFLPALFRNEKQGCYMEVLRKFIEESVEGKRWIYHPRASIVQKQAETELQQWLSEQNVIRPRVQTKTEIDFSLPPLESRPRKQMPTRPTIQNYRCVMCNATWRGVSPKCKNCDTHLFSKALDDNASET